MFSFSRSRRHTPKQRGGKQSRVASRSRPSVEPLEDRTVPSSLGDTLYIGDGGDNTVKKFDAATGGIIH